MKNLYTLLAVILFTSIFFVSSVYASESALKAAVQTKDLAKPVLVLTNTGSEPCQVINSSLGTVAITKVVQDGQTIKPIPIKVKFDDGLAGFLKQNLKTLKPNESVELPLEVEPYESGSAIQSITWSKKTGPFGIIYPLQKNGSYAVEATYTMPIEVTGETPPCGSAAATISSRNIQQYLKYIYIAVGVILLLVVIYFIIRLRKPTKKTKKLFPFFLITILLLLFPTQTVSATYSIPTEDTPTFDDCMRVFDRYPDITGPILDAIDSEQIYIFTNRSRVNDTVDWPDGSYHVRWDPSSEYNYYSDDGSIIPSKPCDRLFHELYHVYELQQGTDSRAECAGSGIDTDEVNATRMQNRLREAMGLPPRTHYDDHRLPAGDCSAPAPAPEPPLPTCSSFGCGMGWGEPHLQSFDLRPYDFQAVGEFVAARDQKGDFEVQTRQQPWATSRFVSMNTAIAMRVAKETVEVRLNNFQLEMLVNGKQEDLKDKKLTGGGSISTLNGDHVVVKWPDGSKVTVNFYSTFGLDMYIQPSEPRKGQLTGLLGNYNEDGSDDLVIQNTSQKVDPEFDQLYPKFADSWRVTKESSLFSYDQGDFTSYTDKSFPDKYNTSSDLPNAEIAEQTCKQLGVTDEVVLKNCILDVGITGRPEFAYAARQIEKSLGASPINSSSQLLNGSITVGGSAITINISKAGTKAVLEFTGQAGKKYNVAITNSTIPDQCGGIGAEDQNGSSIGNACLLAGTANFETIALPKTAKYKITINPANQGLGKATVKIREVL